MAPLPAVPGVVKIKYEWHVGDDLTTSTGIFWTYTGGPPSAADCVAIAAGVRISAATWFPPHMTLSTVLAGVKVTDLSSASGAEGESLLNTPGSESGLPNAGAVAFIVNYGIARRYRGGKPRSYWPFGVAQDLSSPQTWSASALAGVLAAVTGHFADVASITHGTTSLVSHCSVSYYQGSVGSIVDAGKRGKTTPTLRATPVVDFVTSILPRALVGSQRVRDRV